MNNLNVGFVHLGCSKNLIDTEMAIGVFKNAGYNIVNCAYEADIIVVNTCGFIQSAKQEAINTILEMAEYKNKNCKYLIVMGCLVQRYKNELEKNLKEVDLFISIDEYAKFWDMINKLLKNKEVKEENMEYRLREISTGKNTAYLKIAEGCSNNCTYCAIPKIRGKYISRPIEDVLEEAKELYKKGYKELIVVAQDTTKYGIDLYGESKLAYLLEELAKINFTWIRFLYSYPESIDENLIQTVKKNKNICNYFDIPIQHISDKILRRMNRKSSSEKIKKLIKHIREEIPDVIIRTSLIVGFPGETQEDFEELYDFVKVTKFDRLGVFMYSKEEGTPAEKLDNQIHPMTKKSRYNKIMSLQNEISKLKSQNKIGKTYKALIEGTSNDGRYYIARTYMDIPETDGILFIEKKEENLEGNFVNCKIKKEKIYDLFGTII